MATGKKTESVVLEYSLPDFKILPKHPEEREKRKKLIMEGRMKGMLIENSNNRPSFDTMISNHRSGTDRIGNLEGNFYGLDKFSVMDWKEKGMAVQPDDTYIEKNTDGTVRSFIMCSPPGKDKIPSCSHKFRDNGLLYKIRWPLTELPNWRYQRDAAISFINGFEQQEPNK